MLGAIRPTPDFDSKPYWDHLLANELHLQKCENCGKFRFPPYPSCPYCGKDGGKWVPLSGNGKIYSWFIANVSPAPEFKEDLPYVVATIELEEGPRVFARLVNCTPDKVKGDMPVKGKYHKVDDKLTLLVFEPA